jgi:type VI secretion system secreted protein Hcp
MTLHGRVPRISLALIAAAAFALATIAVVNTRSTSHHAALKPVTLETALAAFGGSTNLYLKIATIPGDSTNDRHAHEIDVDTLAWGVANPKVSATGASFSAITITKGIDSASPKLMIATAGGTDVGNTTITATKVGGEETRFATIDLEHTFVTSFNQTANRTSGFDEKIGLRYTKATLTFFKQDASGGSTASIIGCWNLVTKTNCTPASP